MKRPLRIEYAYPVDSLERSRCKGRNEACDEWEAYHNSVLSKLLDKKELLSEIMGSKIVVYAKKITSEWAKLTGKKYDDSKDIWLQAKGEELAITIAKRLGVAEEDIMGGETPELPYNPTQEDMLQIAMRDIRQRKKGRFQLRYNKEKKTIEAIDTAPAEEGAK